MTIDVRLVALIPNPSPEGAGSSSLPPRERAGVRAQKLCLLSKHHHSLSERNPW